MLDTDKNKTASHHHSAFPRHSVQFSPPPVSENQTFRMLFLSRDKVQKIWRHYKTARYYISNITYADTMEKQKIVAKNGEEILQLCAFTVFDHEAERIILKMFI